MPHFEIPWFPQSRQADLLSACGLLPVLDGHPPAAPVAELIGYGGAAFGGKTDGLLGIATVAAFAFPGCRIGFFRRTYPELEGEGGALDRAAQLWSSEIASYHYQQHLYTFFNGSRVRFCHCQHEDDWRKYESNQFDILLFDEATSFTWNMIDPLLTRNRMSGDRTCVAPFAVFCSNPGNVGLVWYKPTFVAGERNVVKRQQLPSDKYAQVIFLPAFLEDNVIGVARDPGYERRLEQRDPVLYQALRWGNWDIFEGQAFRELDRLRHVRPDVELPEFFTRWRGLDWGYVHPFVCGWGSQDPDNGRVYVYRAVKESGLTDRRQAEKIKAMSPESEGVTLTFADPSMWIKKSHEDVLYSTADEYSAAGVLLTKADNDRRSGKRKLHRFLADRPDGRPGLIIFESCRFVYDALAQMIVSKTDPEDCEKMDGDDPYDMVKYLLSNVDVPHVETEDEKERRRKPGKRTSKLADVGQGWL